MIALALLATVMVPAEIAPIRIALQEEPVPVEEWQLDQLRIASDAGEAVLKAIEPAHSLDAVIATLDKMHVVYKHTPAVIVPSRLPADVRDGILALPKGEPFVLAEGPFISISVLVARKLPPGTVRWQPRAIHFLPPREA